MAKLMPQSFHLNMFTLHPVKYWDLLDFGQTKHTGNTERPSISHKGKVFIWDGLRKFRSLTKI